MSNPNQQRYVRDLQNGKTLQPPSSPKDRNDQNQAKQAYSGKKG